VFEGDHLGSAMRTAISTLWAKPDPGDFSVYPEHARFGAFSPNANYGIVLKATNPTHAIVDAESPI
jgi:hypothetical protein